MVPNIIVTTSADVAGVATVATISTITLARVATQEEVEGHRTDKEGKDREEVTGRSTKQS